MSPQYTDAPTFGTSIKLCKPCRISLRQYGRTLDTFLVNNESKNNENYKAFCLQGHVTLNPWE